MTLTVRQLIKRAARTGKALRNIAAMNKAAAFNKAAALRQAFNHQGTAQTQSSALTESSALKGGAALKRDAAWRKTWLVAPGLVHPGAITRASAAPPPPHLSSSIALFVEDLSVSFDGFKALNHLTFYLSKGELRCFIGPNGAGKTTMMDILTGKTVPDEGSAWFNPHEGNVDPRLMYNLLTLDEVDIVTAGIGRKFQKPSVFETLTVGQNLELALKCDKRVFSTLWAHLSSAELDFLHSVLTKIRLERHLNEPAGKLSHGQKQWLEIGMLLMQKPALIMLDEPVAGMTIEEIGLTIELLHELKGAHTIMVVEHDMEFVRQIADKVTVLAAGSVLAEGSMAQVQADPKVITAYLGREEG